MEPTLSSASFDFFSDTPQSLADSNDISFITGFDKSADDFDPLKTNNDFNAANANMLDMFTDHDTNLIDIFGTCGSPKNEDFISKQDPFADTPDWSNVASVSNEELARQQPSTPEQLINGTLHGSVVNGHCGNPFTNTIGRTDFDLNNSFNGQSSDLFTQYLSNAVAQVTLEAPLNNAISNGNESFFIESNNSINNSDQFNIDDQFSANNEFGFHGLNLTDTSGNTTNEFNDTVNDFFGDNYGQGPKAHNITVLTAEDKKFYNFPSPTSTNDIIEKSILTSSDQDLCQVPASREDDTFEKPKASSVSVTYNQVVRPRPTSLAVKSQILLAPPSKQSIKNTPAPAILIKTPTQKTVTSTPSTPLKEEHPSKGFVEDKPKPRSGNSILPNARSAVPAVETRARSRARHAPLQPAVPMKESISRASKSLEDLCSLDSPTSASTKSLSPKSTPGSRAPTDLFGEVTPQF